MATADKPQTDSDGGASKTDDDPQARELGPRSSTAGTKIQTSVPANVSTVDKQGDPVADVESWFGRTIDGRYKIIELLGEGGMGAVFVAEHLALRKNVALKIIRPEFAGVPEIAARFTREAMATAKLDHPHVASALDYGKLPDGAAYLVIQLVRGQPLRGLLEKQSLPWPQACDVVSQIADALAGAHAEGIVHRDLKPDNVLLELRDDGRYLAKVLDFGIARIAADPGSKATPGDGLTRMGMVMGTPGYMSPEQALGEPVDHRTDLYALGVVLWESIAGRPLFTGESLTEVITKQLAEAPTPLTSITGQVVPKLVDELIRQLLARTPSARPESAAQVRETLRKLAASGTPGEADLIALPSSGFAKMRQTERAPTVADTTHVPGFFSRLQTGIHDLWARDRWRLITFGSIAGVLFLLGIIGILGSDQEPTTDAPAAIDKSSAEVSPADTPRLSDELGGESDET
ncbi:MAG TPA: serine/threonine protein kinase, partial [Nannocystis exedens]|nr:serine/threonine protein kinase [Nannocystis exedens]